MTDNSSPNPAVAPASEEEVARKHFPEEYAADDNCKSVDINLAEREKCATAIHEVADPLRKQVRALEQWKRKALVSLSAWDGVQKFIQDDFDVREWGETWQSAVLNRLSELELCRTVIAQISSSGISEATIRDRLRKLLVILQPKAASPEKKEQG